MTPFGVHPYAFPLLLRAPPRSSPTDKATNHCIYFRAAAIHNIPIMQVREGSTKAPRSNRGGAGASTKWMRCDGVMERSRGLHGASVVARGTTLAPPAIPQIMVGPGDWARVTNNHTTQHMTLKGNGRLPPIVTYFMHCGGRDTLITSVAGVQARRWMRGLCSLEGFDNNPNSKRCIHPRLHSTLHPVMHNTLIHVALLLVTFHIETCCGAVTF